jgi:antitoxin HicB
VILYIAEFLDLPGCSASGATVEEAYQRAQTAKQEWLRLSQEQGLPIPKPSRADEYSGRFLLRLPPSLHAILAERAKLQASSLNQYAVHLLSGAVVGDSVSTQIDHLKTKVAGLELQLRQLSRNLELSHPPTIQQTLGTNVMVSTGLETSGIFSTGLKIQHLGPIDDWGQLVVETEGVYGLSLDKDSGYVLKASKPGSSSGVTHFRGEEK